MTDKEIEKLYEIIRKYHKKFLADKGVKLPNLKNKSGNYIRDALVLIRLAQGYPDTEIVSKEELTDFIKKFYPRTPDVQQGRHLGMQKGWYIKSGTRGDSSLPSGSYRLVTLKTSYPNFRQERRVGIASSDFEKIKKLYGYKCASCGSKEGFHNGVKIELQKGHMNPLKPLEAGNIIPQCQICNRAYRNRWIYDKTGRVIEVANTPDGLRVVKKFIKNTSAEFRKILCELIKSLVKS